MKRAFRLVSTVGATAIAAAAFVTPSAAHATTRRVVHPLASAPWAVAIQANDNGLWIVSTASGVKQTHLAMRPSTNPSIAALADGYGVAYEGSDSSLHTYDAHTQHSSSAHLGMMPGTSPSYARLTGTNSAAIAIQANNGVLWAWSTTNGVENLHIGMQAGTSPSIAGLSAGGYEIAYEGTDHSLHVYSSITKTASSLHLGMTASSSPSITPLQSGGFAIAINTNHSNLWTWASGVGAKDLSTSLRADTSPSIAATPAGYEVAAIGSSGDLLTVTTSGSVDTHRVPYTGSSPSIAALANGTYEIAYQAPNASLFTYDPTNGAVDRHLGMFAGTAPSVAG